MNTKNKKFRRATRLLLGIVAAALLVLFALATYVEWALNVKYFHDHGWPRFGWSKVVWLHVAIYLSLAACSGRWRLFGR